MMSPQLQALTPSTSRCTAIPCPMHAEHLQKVAPHAYYLCGGCIGSATGLAPIALRSRLQMLLLHAGGQGAAGGTGSGCSAGVRTR